ncbi:MAG: ribosomal protein S18-alanine N-acetyltransferase [Syntrophomonadaceae bacterium]
MNEAKVIVRPITSDDLPLVSKLEMEIFPDPWNEQQFLYELIENPYATIVVLTYRDIIIGYCDFWLTFGSATINKIAVRPEFRGMGLGKLLLDDVLRRINSDLEVAVITLEVRVSNQTAINLYKEVGFEIDHRKTAYYSDGEDAYYMLKVLGGKR